jgi:hypothetical protein
MGKEGRRMLIDSVTRLNHLKKALKIREIIIVVAYQLMSHHLIKTRGKEILVKVLR